MVFGIDDLLAAAIAASTSYMAWSRIDHLMDRVTTRCKPQIRRHFERASESPSFLLKGFDVSTAGNLPHKGRFNHRRSAAFLLSCPPSEMEAQLPAFDRLSLQYVFGVVARAGLWAQGVRLTEACGAVGVEVRPLYVEATLHACIAHCEFVVAAAYFVSFGQSMPIDQSLLTALVIGCAEHPRDAKAVLEAAVSCHNKLSADLLAAGVVSTAQIDWGYSVGLLRTLQSTWPSYSLRDVFSSLALAALPDARRFDWLLEEISRSCPKARTDVFLRMLESDIGTRRYNEMHSSQATWQTAVDYFGVAPTSANAMSCSRILMTTHRNPSEVVNIVKSVDLSDVQWAALGALVGSSSDGSVAAALAQQMILRSTVSPALILKPVAKQEMWPAALRLLTLSLTHRKVMPSSSEIGLAVRASVSLGRWASAYFWIERSHASFTRLPSPIYDCAFESARHVPWESTVRVVRSMQDVGGSCGESGVLSLLSAAADRRRTPDMLRLLATTNTVNWVQ